MEPVLIQVATASIKNEQYTLNAVVTYLQAVYDACAAQSVSVTIQDLLMFKQWCEVGSNFPLSLEHFVRNQLVEKAVPAANFNGVPIQIEKLRDLIVMPDLAGIKSAVTALVNRGQNYNGLQIRINLLALNNGVIAKVADADAQLTALYTYYTKTDASAQLATDLLAIGVQLETLSGKYKHYKITPPAGLVGNNAGFVLDLTAIRNYEADLSSGGYSN